MQHIRDFCEEFIDGVILEWHKYRELIENKYWPKKIVISIGALGIALATIALILAGLSIVTLTPGAISLLFLDGVGLMTIAKGSLTLFQFYKICAAIGTIELILVLIIFPMVRDWAMTDDPVEL